MSFARLLDQDMNRVVFTKTKGGDGDDSGGDGGMSSTDFDMLGLGDLLGGGDGGLPGIGGFDDSLFNVTSAPPTEVTNLVTTADPQSFHVAESVARSFEISGLQYFTTYDIKVCACTAEPRGGCAVPDPSKMVPSCASVFGKTGPSPTADDIVDVPVVEVLGKSRFNLSWAAPVNPNQVVVRYDISIEGGSQDDSQVVDNYICESGQVTWIERSRPAGKYQVECKNTR